jgi:hypothetical protein
MDHMWTTRADAFDNGESRDGSDDSDDLHVPPHLHDRDVENHHGVYWKHDGVLEASVNKMTDTSGRLKPEEVRKFYKHVTSFICIHTGVLENHIQRNQ